MEMTALELLNTMKQKIDDILLTKYSPSTGEPVVAPQFPPIEEPFNTLGDINPEPDFSPLGDEPEEKDEEGEELDKENEAVEQTQKTADKLLV